MAKDDAPRLPPSGGTRKVKCKGRTVIRWDFTDDDHRRGDPKLDENNRRQYRPCIAWAANGTDYCTAHGGSTPAAIQTAKRTIMLATPDAAEVLLELLHDDRVTPADRIKAAVQLLDRGGIRAGVDVSLETPGYLQVLAQLTGRGNDDESEDEAPPAEAPPAEPTPPPRKRAPRKATPPPPPDNVVPLKRKAAPSKATKATPPKHQW